MASMLTRRIAPRGFVLVAAETVLIIGAVAVAAYIRLGEWMSVVMTEENGFYKALIVAAVCQLCLYYADLYDFRQITDRRDLIMRILQALGAASFILAADLFLVPRADDRPRSVPDRRCARHGARSPAGAWRSNGCRSSSARESVFCWSGQAPRPFSSQRELFERRHELGVEIVGFVDPDPAKVGRAHHQPGGHRHASTIFRASCGRTRSTASSSAWPTPAASCRWTSCSR